MSKRNYTHIKELLPTIEAMVAEGTTQREIAEHFGFKDKYAVKEALKRARRKAIIIPKARGRKPAKTLQEYKYENKRLKIEAVSSSEFDWFTSCGTVDVMVMFNTPFRGQQEISLIGAEQTTSLLVVMIRTPLCESRYRITAVYAERCILSVEKAHIMVYTFDEMSAEVPFP